MNKEAKFIKEFTPNWFAVIMGNGGVALVLNHFAMLIPALWYVSILLWSIDIVLFIVFSSLFIIRFCYYPEHFHLMMTHPVQPLFLGCIPMGLITIVNGFLAFGVPLFGPTAISVALVCWWVAVALSLIVAWLLPLAMFSIQRHSSESMTPVWLLPIVACEVSAASGGLLLPHMPVSMQTTVLFLCLILWAISVLSAFSIITIFFKRLVIHSLPSNTLAPSVWLVLGPIGTGALGLMTLGQASSLISLTDVPQLQSLFIVFPGISLWAAIILLGFGFWWLIVAIISTLYQLIKGIDFALSWWAFTFPLAVYTLGLLAVADHVKLLFFIIPAIACTILLVFLWFVVLLKTTRGTLNQSLFSAPCLKETK